MASLTPEKIWIRGEGGGIFALTPPLHESIADRMAKGYIVRVNPDGTPFDVNPDLPATRPAFSARKIEWVGWAVKNGMDPDTAEFATKQDLIEKFTL